MAPIVSAGANVCRLVPQAPHARKNMDPQKGNLLFCLLKPDATLAMSTSTGDELRPIEFSERGNSCKGLFGTAWQLNRSLPKQILDLLGRNSQEVRWRPDKEFQFRLAPRLNESRKLQNKCYPDTNHGSSFHTRGLKAKLCFSPATVPAEQRQT